jgi:hypothetical protein
LERAADAAKITYPGEKAIIDVIHPAREGTEISSEHLSHQLRIAGDLKLGKGGISRERLKAHDGRPHPPEYPM